MLYLGAMMQMHPTEHPIRRRQERDFRAEYVDKYGRLAREWLEWTAEKERKENKDFYIRHKFNGKEHVLGKRKIRVDGWDGKTAYQFHG